MDQTDMVMVKSGDGYSAGGFLVDSCILGTCGQKGGGRGATGDIGKLAVPAGLASVDSSDEIHSAIRSAIRTCHERSMIDEDVYNCLVDAMAPSKKKKMTRKARGKTGGRQTRKR